MQFFTKQITNSQTNTVGVVFLYLSDDTVNKFNQPPFRQEIHFQHIAVFQLFNISYPSPLVIVQCLRSDATCFW